MTKKKNNFWSYKANPPPNVVDLPPNTFNGTQEEFEQLSPGYRREILRTANKMERENKFEHVKKV